MFNRRLEIMRSGERVPDFELPDGNGHVHKLSDYLQRYNIVLFFFRNSESETAAAYLTELNNTYQAYHEHGAETIVVLSCHTLDEGEKIITDLHLTYPVLVDETCMISAQYVPPDHAGVFIIDRNGKLGWQFIAVNDTELPVAQRVFQWLHTIET